MLEDEYKNPFMSSMTYHPSCPLLKRDDSSESEQEDDVNVEKALKKLPNQGWTALPRWTALRFRGYSPGPKEEKHESYLKIIQKKVSNNTFTPYFPVEATRLRLEKILRKEYRRILRKNTVRANNGLPFVSTCAATFNEFDDSAEHASEKIEELKKVLSQKEEQFRRAAKTIPMNESRCGSRSSDYSEDSQRNFELRSKRESPCSSRPNVLVNGLEEAGIQKSDCRQDQLVDHTAQIRRTSSLPRQVFAEGEHFYPQNYGYDFSRESTYRSSTRSGYNGRNYVNHYSRRRRGNEYRHSLYSKGHGLSNQYNYCRDSSSSSQYEVHSSNYEEDNNKSNRRIESVPNPRHENEYYRRHSLSRSSSPCQRDDRRSGSYSTQYTTRNGLSSFSPRRPSVRHDDYYNRTVSKNDHRTRSPSPRRHNTRYDYDHFDHFSATVVKNQDKARHYSQRRLEASNGKGSSHYNNYHDMAVKHGHSALPLVHRYNNIRKNPNHIDHFDDDIDYSKCNYSCCKNFNSRGRSPSPGYHDVRDNCVNSNLVQFNGHRIRSPSPRDRSTRRSISPHRPLRSCKNRSPTLDSRPKRTIPRY